MFIATVVYSQNKDNKQNVNPLPDTTGVVALTSTTSSLGNIYQPQFVPPLPTSAIYQRYAATPPNLSTGTVNINIPLYTLNVNGFELPFSLNYQTSGIKVLDPYYPLGYGWVFTPGLRITRTIMGNADDKTPRTIKDASDLLNNDTETNFLYSKSLLIEPPQSGNLLAQDAQYDIYSIHLPETNVRFVMEKVNNAWQAVTIGSALKITPVLSSTGEFNGFEVKDDRGVIYQFGEVTSYTPPTTETKSSFIEISPRNRGNSAWMLRKIILPGSDNTISFSWQVGTYETGIIPLDDYYDIEDLLHTYQLTGEPPCVSDNFSFLGDSGYKSEYGVSSGALSNTFPCMFLQTVQFRSGKIEITYGADKLMKTMQVYSNHTGSYSVVKSIDFNTTIAGSKALLRGLTVGQEKYTFEYNESYPSVDKNARDWWGYYNGKNNPNAIPKTSFILTTSQFASNNQPVMIGDANRDVDAAKMQQNILTKINYPTGGYTKYEYEPHKFNGSVFNEGGGLRVKKITTKESDTAPENISEYRYGTNESGLGACTMEPVPSSFFQETSHSINPLKIVSIGCSYNYRQLILTSESKISNYTAFNPDVWYNEVTEYSSEGKTIYQFEYNADNPFTLQLHSVVVTPSNQTLNLIGYYTNLFKQGPRLRYTKIYKKESSGTYKQLQEEEIQYTSISGHSNLPGLYAERKVYCDEYADGIYDYSYTSYPNGLISMSFVYSNYWINVEAEKIAYRIKKYFDPSGNILDEKTDYSYIVQNGIINLSSEVTTSSDKTSSGANKTITKQRLYPLSDLSTLTQEQKAVAQRMVDLNLLTTPLVEVQTFENAQTTLINQYKDWGNNLLLPEKIYTKTGSTAAETRLIYNNYDTKGNPLYITKDNADQVVYLWSYNYQYPVAEIKNATLAEVNAVMNTVFGVADAEALSALATPNEAKLKDGSLQKALPNALVTTYTYKPLVGILSMTDPRGVITTYDYDTFNRLKTVKDNKSQPVEGYDYHYKN